MLEALKPKQREDGETMKWSSVCCEQAQGVKPGDPTFTAWVRLAATPVRDVKAIVNPRGADDRGRRGRGRGGRQGGGGGGGTAAAAAGATAATAATTAAAAAAAAATSSSTAATARSAPPCGS